MDWNPFPLDLAFFFSVIYSGLFQTRLFQTPPLFQIDFCSPWLKNYRPHLFRTLLVELQNKHHHKTGCKENPFWGCPLCKLYLSCISPNVTLTSPKEFYLIQYFCNLNSLKILPGNFTCSKRTESTNLTAKSTSPRLLTEILKTMTPLEILSVRSKVNSTTLNVSHCFVTPPLHLGFAMSFKNTKLFNANFWAKIPYQMFESLQLYTRHAKQGKKCIWRTYSCIVHFRHAILGQQRQHPVELYLGPQNIPITLSMGISTPNSHSDIH